MPFLCTNDASDVIPIEISATKVFCMQQEWYQNLVTRDMKIAYLWIFGIMLITWLLYRIIKICVCHFQRCFSKRMHLTALDTILSLIIFCYRGFSENQRRSAVLEQNSIAKYGFMNLLKASRTFCYLIGCFIQNIAE